MAQLGDKEEKMANGQERQGFYDPSMAGPNIPQGLRGLLGQMMMLKQLKEGQAQEKWQRGITERETASKEDYYGAMAEKARREDTTGGMNQWQHRAQFAQELLDNEVIDQGEFDKYMLTGQLDKPMSEYQILLQEQKKTGTRRAVIDQAIDAFEGRKKFKEQPMSLGQYIALGEDAPEIEMSATHIKNLGYGLTELKRLKGLLETGKLTDEDFAHALNIFSRMNRIEERGPFWESGMEELDITTTGGIPREVQKFLLDHPEMTIGEALQLWKEMKIK